ncbi:hypothetical protein M3J09_003369 [Ascochyta lentis]
MDQTTCNKWYDERRISVFDEHGSHHVRFHLPATQTTLMRVPFSARFDKLPGTLGPHLPFLMTDGNQQSDPCKWAATESPNQDNCPSNALNTMPLTHGGRCTRFPSCDRTISITTPPLKKCRANQRRFQPLLKRLDPLVMAK